MALEFEVLGQFLTHDDYISATDGNRNHFPSARFTLKYHKIRETMIIFLVKATVRFLSW